MSIVELPERDQELVYEVLMGQKTPSHACREASVDRYAFAQALGSLGPEHKYVNGRFVKRPVWRRNHR